MKRIISMMLAVLMLLPIFASLAFAVSPEDIVVTDEPQNIAGIAEFSVSETSQITADWVPEYLVDGHKDVGTYSPRGRTPAFKMDFGKEFYISEVLLVVNGNGDLLGEEITEILYDVAGVQIRGYNRRGEMVKDTGITDTSSLLECKIAVDEDVQVLEIILIPAKTSNSATCSIWEVEAYTQIPPERCNAEQENIASQALLSSTYYDREKQENVPSSWWAMKLSNMTDGDIHTGTQTVKSANFSLWLNFGQEHHFSDVTIFCNGRGTLSSGDKTENMKDSNGQLLGPDQNLFRTYSLTVVMYNFNDEIVFQSDKADVGGITELTVEAGVDAATIELKISDAGDAGYSGAVYIWDVIANEETGTHMYREIDKQNPSCGIPGYKKYQCMKETCGMTKVEVVEGTGYHEWDEGKITTEATKEANGVRTLTCKECGETVERDVPALEHNWDAGTKITALCADNYTLYKCKDGGCELTYSADYTRGMGHNYNDGVITKRATTEETGIMLFTCQREGCKETDEGHFYEKTLRKAKYIDTTEKITADRVVEFIGSAHQDMAKNVFDGTLDDQFWCAPGKFTETKVDKETIQTRESGYLEIIFDKEYYFTKGVIHVFSNWNWMEVHFMYKDDNGDWQKSASYIHDRIDTKGEIAAQDMTADLNQGARASKIVIETVGSIGDPSNTSVKTHYQMTDYPGSGLRFYEIELEAHKCELLPEDYEDESKWVKPTCTSNGSCKATCPVCSSVSTVVLESDLYAHDFGELTVIDAPTCSEVGFGNKTCKDCNKTVQADIPATGKHNYNKDIVFMTPDCSTKGIGQHVCEMCGDVSYNYSIDPTGEHNFKYITKSEANYTAIGKQVFACEYCELQGDGEDIVTEKLTIPNNILTFTGYSIRLTDYIGIRASFKLNREAIAVLEETCDVTIIVNATNIRTKENVSAVVYGKQLYYSNEEKFNENDEFAAVAKITNCNSEYEFSYDVKLKNFRGTEIKNFKVPAYVSTKTSVCIKDIIPNVMNSSSIRPEVRKLLQEMLDDQLGHKVITVQE